MNRPAQPHGRPFSIAMAFLGLFALCQVLAVAWAGVSGRALGNGSALVGPVSGDGRADAPEPTFPGTGRDLAAAPAAPAPGEPAALAPVRPAATSAPVSASPRLLLPASREIRDPEVLEAIEEAIGLRKEGDTQGALSALRRADLLLPDHPVVLHEMARTHALMGLDDKAAAHWARILEMGEAGAGDYHALAAVELGRGTARAPSGPSGVLRIGSIATTARPDAGAGQRVNVRVPVHATGAGPVDRDAVTVYVYLFDKSPEGRIAQTTAAEPEYRWRSGDVDWSDLAEPEILEVAYHHPAAAAQGARYYGCIVKLYHEDQLEDVAAEPRILFEQISETPLDAPRIDDTLFRLE